MTDKVKIEDLKKMEEQNWGYHSYRLNKDFSTLKELQEAEDSYNKEQSAKEAQLAERKADAKQVEDALRKLCEVKKECFKQIKDAETNYYVAREKFIKKYGSYHATYSNNDGNESIKVSDFFSTFLNNFLDIINS